MKKNVGSTDKILRYILGIVIIALGLVYNSWWGLIGLVPIFTAAMGWCPLYVLFKTSTNKTNKG